MTGTLQGVCKYMREPNVILWMQTWVAECMYTVKSAVNYRGLNTVSELAACQSTQIRSWGKKNLLKEGILLSAKHRGYYIPLSRQEKPCSQVVTTPANVPLFSNILYHDMLLGPMNTKYTVLFMVAEKAHYYSWGKTHLIGRWIKNLNVPKHITKN